MKNYNKKCKFVIITPSGINVKSEFYKIWENGKILDEVWTSVDISKDKFIKEYMCDFKK